MTKYRFFTIKRYLEQFIMFPFVLFGKLYAHFKPLNDKYDIFFFFPTYAIGGAERVNAEIAKSFPDKKCIIFFTKKSPNNGMKHFFEMPHITIIDISKWVDNKWVYFLNFFYRGICSGYINKQSTTPIIFIGQCNFAYKLTPHIRRNIKIHELIHMYDSRFTWVWAPFVKFIDTRIVIGEVIKNKFKNAYLRNGIPITYFEKFKIIFYNLEYLPNQFYKREFSLPLKIYYAGRGGAQKRVWLILKIIAVCKNLQLPVQFKLAGPIENEIPNEYLKEGIYVGKLTGGEEMYNFHKQNDILIMTSAWEGFPIVIMEAMSFGSIPLVTNIDAIPEHIKDGINGFLINETSNEEKLVDEFVEKIKAICEYKYDLYTISKNTYSYAINNFSEDNFRFSYRNLFFS